jgi:two-component system, NtrC family, sensor histidine kinase HydH
VSFFEEIKAYVAFGAADAAALAALRPRLAPRFGGFADHFYDVILRHPRASDAITGGAAQVERLKQTLVAWMDSGLAGPHDDAYCRRRARIGRVHVTIGLPQEFMFTAMDVMRLDFHHAIAELDGASGGGRTFHDAIDKLFDLELAIMLRHYQRDSELRAVQRERGALVDRVTAMQTLTAGLAHEVRNPLNAAKLQLELLDRRLRKSHDDDRLLEPARLVHQEIQRLTQLLNEFLDFARPAQLSLGEHDLLAIARHVIELERAAAEARGVTVEVSTTSDRVLAWADAARISQILLNLVQNALEAVGLGGRVEVRVAGVAGGGAVLVVADNGHGIPPAVLARIYEPFFSTKESGTGLGMSIVHSLVDLHGATIDIETGAAGTEVIVRLPPRPGG